MELASVVTPAFWAGFIAFVLALGIVAVILATSVAASLAATGKPNNRQEDRA